MTSFPGAPTKYMAAFIATDMEPTDMKPTDSGYFPLGVTRYGLAGRLSKPLVFCGISPRSLVYRAALY